MFSHCSRRMPATIPGLRNTMEVFCVLFRDSYSEACYSGLWHIRISRRLKLTISTSSNTLVPHRNETGDFQYAGWATCTARTG